VTSNLVFLQGAWRISRSSHHHSGAGLAQSVKWLDYGLNDRGNVVRFWSGAREFSVLQNIQTTSETYLVSYSMSGARPLHHHTPIRCAQNNLPFFILSFGWFPSVWILFPDVSEHPVFSIFIGRVEHEHDLWRWDGQTVILGDSPESAFYVPTFRNTVPSSQVVFVFHTTYEDGKHRMFRNVGK